MLKNIWLLLKNSHRTRGEKRELPLDSSTESGTHDGKKHRVSLNLSLACTGIESIFLDRSSDDSINASVWSAIRMQSEEVHRLIDETTGIINSLTMGSLEQVPLDGSIPELTGSEADYSETLSQDSGLSDQEFGTYDTGVEDFTDPWAMSQQSHALDIGLGRDMIFTPDRRVYCDDLTWNVESESDSVFSLEPSVLKLIRDYIFMLMLV